MKIKINNDEFIISSNKEKLQLEVIHCFLSNTYWAKDIPISLVKKSIENSLCFGVYHQNNQIGFARVVTDYTTFAYLADVFILEEYRGKGLSKHLMKFIIEFPELQNLRTWLLKTKDAHGLYKQFGFNSPKFPERVMEFSNLPKGYSNFSK
jgi:GNAT superfamily N-acetyltransferase